MTRATHLDRAILEAIARAIADEERRIKTTPEMERQYFPFIRGAVQIGKSLDVTIAGSTDTTPDSSSIAAYEIHASGVVARKKDVEAFNLAVNQIDDEKFLLLSVDRFGVAWVVAESP